jgi:cation:H+ antiporter
VPYLLVVLLLAALTLPQRWAGLQPRDGLILLAAFGVYFVHALFRNRQPCDPEAMPAGAVPRGLLGLPAIAGGALASVIGARHLDEALGIPDLIGGLFIIGLLCALPESFAAWTLARERKTTTAVSTAVADGIVSLTLALIPPALVGAAIGNVAIYVANLAFLAAVLVVYLVLNHRSRGQELGLGRVSLFGGGYAIYVAATVLLLIR